MSPLSERLRQPNTYGSVGVPEWFDGDAIDDFLTGDVVVVREDVDCTVGYALSPDHGNATCFLLVGDEHLRPAWAVPAISSAANAARRAGAVRFEVWVPAWNLELDRALYGPLSRDGLLRGVLFAYGRRWDVSIFSADSTKGRRGS